MNNENYKGHIFTVCHHKYFGDNFMPRTAKEISFLKKSYWARCKTNNNVLHYLSSHIDKEQIVLPNEKESKITNFSGFFSKNKLLTKNDIKVLKETLQNTDATIYTAIFSFSNETNVKCKDSTMAREIIQNTFDDFLKKAKLKPDNVEWFGCIHTNTDHIHSHIVFFEKEKKFIDYVGNVNYRTTVHNKLPVESLNYYRDQVGLYMIQHASAYKVRDQMIELFKLNIKEPTTKDIIHKYSSQMSDFSVKQYNRLNSYNKNIVDSCLDEIINKNKELKKKKEGYENYLDSIQEDLEIYAQDVQSNHSSKKMKSYKKEKIDYLHNRFGNQVLKIMIMDKELNMKKSQYKREKSSKTYYANSSSLIRKKAINSRAADYEYENTLKKLIEEMCDSETWQFDYKDISEIVKSDSEALTETTQSSYDDEMEL